MILAPVGLVMVQPDLGTAMMVLLGGAALLFVAGVRLWMFLGAIVAAVGCLPFAWSFMHEYQRKRVLTFLDPDRDPLGAGYHITQSKIAIGSGGLFGKGFLQGHPVVAELPAREADRLHLHDLRRGMGHGRAPACCSRLFALVLVWGFSIALRSQHHFGRLVALGVTAMMFLYVFINTAMVMGLLPGGRRAAAAGQQRRHRHGLGDVCLRPADRRQRLPRRAIAAAPAEWRGKSPDSGLSTSRDRLAKPAPLPASPGMGAHSSVGRAADS